MNLIDSFERNLNKELDKILENTLIYEVDIDDIKYKIGFIHTLYKYRNDLSEAVLKNNVNDIDLLGMIISDRDTVSYRRIKDVDVSKIAVYFGGKGHREAASNPQNNEKFAQILKLFV